MEYYSGIKRKETESAMVMWVNLESVIEWSKSEKQISYINAYIHNLEKWYWWTYLQGRSREADVESRLVDTAGEGVGGMNWEGGADMCMTMCKIAS